MEWHGAIAIYVIGTLALIISAVHTAVTSQEKGILMNGFELEKNLDEKKYRQVKTLLLALQCFLLILYVVLFICIGNKNKPPAMQVCSQTALASSKKPPCYNEYKVRQPNHYNKEESKWTIIVYHTQNGHANII